MKAKCISIEPYTHKTVVFFATSNNAGVLSIAKAECTHNHIAELDKEYNLICRKEPHITTHGKEQWIVRDFSPISKA